MISKHLYALMAIAIVAFASCGDAGNNSKTTVSAEKTDESLLRGKIDSIAKTVEAKISIATINVETGDTFSYNGYAHVPMQSTAKFPLALMVMQQVDSGKLSPEQKVQISKAEMEPYPRSPLRDSCYGKAAHMTIHDMLVFMTTVSDNISCDVFTRMVGGPEKLTANTNKLGMQGFKVIGSDKKPMFIDFSRPYENWCEPMDMARLLVKFYKGNVLSKTGTDTLRSIMERTKNRRIRGLLPEGTVVAHKTGTGGMEDGVTVAVNDIGIVTLPNGKHIAMAIYITELKGDMAAGEAIIARVAKAAYDDILTK